MLTQMTKPVGDIHPDYRETTEPEAEGDRQDGRGPGGRSNELQGAGVLSLLHTELTGAF